MFEIRQVMFGFFMSVLAVVCLSGCTGTGTATGVDTAVAAPKPPGPVSVAVWDFEDLSPIGHGQQAMGELLSGQVAASLDTTGAYQVVERQELLRVIEELHLGSSQLADAETRLRLGRIIGARQMVFGAFQVIGSSMRLDVRRVDVASGKVLKTANHTAASDDISAWLDAAQQAAATLILP
jgi:curli biogenesis system outer membrane secretion channel CsgG